MSLDFSYRFDSSYIRATTFPCTYRDGNGRHVRAAYGRFCVPRSGLCRWNSRVDESGDELRDALLPMEGRVQQSQRAGLREAASSGAGPARYIDTVSDMPSHSRDCWQCRTVARIELRGSFDLHFAKQLLDHHLGGSVSGNALLFPAINRRGGDAEACGKLDPRFAKPMPHSANFLRSRNYH